MKNNTKQGTQDKTTTTNHNNKNRRKTSKQTHKIIKTKNKHISNKTIITNIKK